MKTFVPGKTYIPPSGQEITVEDKDYLHEVVDEGWYTENRECIKLRREIGKRFPNDVKVILTNSGSSASLVAISSLVEWVGKKREFTYVLTCATGFPTTVSPIYQCGKIPIYIDIDPRTLSPNTFQIQQAVKLYGKEIGFAVFAHTLGFPFMEYSIRKMLGDDIPLISDCCDALGAQYYAEGEWKNVGSDSELSTLSFFPAHHITTGEGGAVIATVEELGDICRGYTEWGRSCYCNPGQQNTCGHRFDYPDRGDLPEGWDHKYIFDRLGYNLKMTELQAGLGVSQFQRLDQFITARIANYNYLHKSLEIFGDFLRFVFVSDWSHPSPFGLPIMLKEGTPFSVLDITSYLEKHKVGTRRVFGGNLIKQPAFRSLPFYHLDLSGSDEVMDKMFWIGVQPALGKPELEYMIEQFYGFFKERGI